MEWKFNRSISTPGGTTIMRRITNWGGIAASIILIAFGVGALVMGLNGRSTVSDSVKQEQIVGSPDMTPSAIKAEAAKAGLNVSALDIPSSSVANVKIDSPSRARTFAGYMRIHALEATGGKVYAQMPRYLDKNGKPTDNEAQAAVDPKTKAPVQNQARNIWVTETALTTALNTSYFANQVAMFGIVMGIAMLLVGIGFGVVTIRLLLAPEEETEKAPAKARTAPATA
jgi:hypothetical protein